MGDFPRRLRCSTGLGSREIQWAGHAVRFEDGLPEGDPGLCRPRGWRRAADSAKLTKWCKCTIGNAAVVTHSVAQPAEDAGRLSMAVLGLTFPVEW